MVASSSFKDTMSLNNLQVALQILPLPQQHNNSTIEPSIVKVSENQVILSAIPNAPIFPFSHVLDINSQQEQHDNYLFDTIPHLTISQLAQGNDASIVIYDSYSSSARFDTKIMLAFSDLFNLDLDDYEVLIKFIEYENEKCTSGKDLISRDSNDDGREYKIDNVDIIEKYYKFGLNQRTAGTVTVFSIILKQKAYTSQLNIIDLSGSDHATLDLFAETCIKNYRDNPVNNTSSTSIRNKKTPASITSTSCIITAIQKSSYGFILACVSYLDSISQLEHTLSYVSNIYEKTGYRSDNLKRSASLTAGTTSAPPLKNKSAQNDDTEYLRRIILKLTNELNILRHSSLASSYQQQQQQQRGRGSLNTMISSSVSSENDHGPRHVSMFSSVSNSTSMTVPDPILEEKEHMLIADLNRQIEELENQITVTRERNTHVERELQEMRSKSTMPSSTQEQLLSIQEKQSCIIDGLEWKLNEMEQLNHDLYQKLLLETENSAIVKRQLEEDFQDIRYGMNHLGTERHQLDQVLNVVENMVWKGDKDNCSALQELALLKSQLEKQNDELIWKNEQIETLTFQLYNSKNGNDDLQNHYRSYRMMASSGDDSPNSSDFIFNQRTLALESRVEELDEYIEHIRSQRDHYSDQLEERIDEADKLQHSFVMQTAKASALEKKLADLEEELKSNRTMIREGDLSGLVEKLENEIARLEQEKRADEQDFEASYENALNEIEMLTQRMSQQDEDIQRLESTMDNLNQQLDETTNSYIQKEVELLDLQSQFETVQKLNLEIKHKLQRVILGQRQQQQNGYIENGRKDSIESHRISNASSASSLMRKQQRSTPNLGADSIRQSLLAEYQPIDQNELLRWVQERIDDTKGGRAEVIRKFTQMSNENTQLALWIGDLESQILAQRHHLTQEAKTLECEVMNLTVINNQLERELEQVSQQHKNRGAKMERSKSSNAAVPTVSSYDLVAALPNRSSSTSRRNNNASRGPTYSPSLSHRSVSIKQQQQHKRIYNINNNRDYLDKRVSTATSIQSDVSGLRWNASNNNRGSMNRSTTPNLPSPSEPPNNPLPPVPMLPYIPNNNSTSPLPPTQQQQQHVSINSILNPTTTATPEDRDSRLSSSIMTSNPSSPVIIEQYDNVLRNHKLKINVAENDIKAHQQVIYKLESQLAISEAKVQEQRQEIECLLDEHETLEEVKNEAAMTAMELKNERALKLKAEKAHHILEKRMEELMNTKKNKFLCF